MAKREAATTPASGAGTTFTDQEVEALKMLVGRVMVYDTIRAPYSGAVQSVMVKLGLLTKSSPETKKTAVPFRAPVRSR